MKTQKKTPAKKASQKPQKPKQPALSAPVSSFAPAPAPRPTILPTTEKTLAISYMELRTAIGGLAFAIPFAVSLVAWLFFKQGQQSSISAYYYTGAGDILVGALFATGFFLFSYRYESAKNIAAKLTFVFALGIALFPTTPPPWTGIPITDTAKIIGWIHLGFAAAFFLTLSYFCLFLFVKTNATPENPMTQRKIYRNRVYRVCGVIMVICIALMALYNLTGGDETNPLASLSPTYWLETVAILAFGISWLTKGQAILKDEV